MTTDAVARIDPAATGVKLIDERKKAAASDAEALARDLELFPPPEYNQRGEPRWEGSAAHKLL